MSSGPKLRIAFTNWLAGRGASTQALYTAQALAELGLSVTVLDCHPRQDLARFTSAVPDLPFVVVPVGPADGAPRVHRVLG